MINEINESRLGERDLQNDNKLKICYILWM